MATFTGFPASACRPDAASSCTRAGASTAGETSIGTQTSMFGITLVIVPLCGTDRVRWSTAAAMESQPLVPDTARDEESLDVLDLVDTEREWPRAVGIENPGSSRSPRIRPATPSVWSRVSGWGVLVRVRERRGQEGRSEVGLLSWRTRKRCGALAAPDTGYSS